MRYLLVVLLVLVGCTKEKEAASIFRVENISGGSYGTAFIIGKSTDSTFFLTNAHVCAETETTVSDFLYLEQQGDELPTIAHAVGFDFVADLCLVKVDKLLDAPILPLTLSSNIGKEVFTLGYPKGNIKIQSQHALYFSKEAISVSAPPELCGMSYPFSDCRVRIPVGIFRDKVVGGQSGSPVFNAKGEVLGIISRSDERKTGLFITTDLIVAFLESQLKQAN